MSGTSVDPEFTEAAARIADDRAEWFEDLRELNRGHVTGSDLEALTRRSDATDAEVEQLRKRFFPRVHELIITSMGACTVSRTGRSSRMVWDRPARGIWDEPA